ncbi:RBBP8 N-terminal-like protein isoform X2 [Xenopus laevis]|uniref:RBBP8 N-terminal-like protein isoform X2 n=1 Tax=Xenopus laevis TaxID=8355 RepID=A0A8J0TZ73_XENLA|nr:RBBP8 N-terminal-like protein isoform X2 [Xenopus laevis]
MQGKCQTLHCCSRNKEEAISETNMANESFADALQRLKEIHDKELLGTQAKLSELTMEKSRPTVTTNHYKFLEAYPAIRTPSIQLNDSDAQRIEELFSKNHLLREQHKVLNENIKVLENRLRAGLCDRCTVTQELAKKKQQEFENSHLHSLQQISVLAHEMKSLKEENRCLLEELKKLQCLDNKHHRSFSPDIKAAPDSPQTLSDSITQKNGVEKTSKEEKLEEHVPGHQDSEEKYSVAAKLSPGGKTSQISGTETHFQETHLPMTQKIFLSSLNQQKISNQLHGTIAVLRPGFRSGRAGIPPSLNKQASTNEMYSKGSGVDSNNASSQLESLKHDIPKEQMCLLQQHLAQRRLGPHAPVAIGDGRCIISKGQDTEATKKVSQDDWDERVVMAELHGAMMYLRDRGFRGRVIHPDQRDRLNYILTRQHQGQRSPKSPGNVPASQQRDSIDERELSLFHMLSAHWKNKQHESQTDEKGLEKEPKYEGHEKREQEEPTPDKPLDLSDARRGQPSYWSGSKGEQRGTHEGFSISPTFTNNFCPQAMNTDVRGSEDNRLSTSLVKEENIFSQDESTIDIKRNSSPSTDKERDGICHKRLTRGHKRERSLEPDMEEEHDPVNDVQSPQMDLDEMETSDSEAETESTHLAVSEGQRDGFSKDGTNQKNKWIKKGNRASSKSMKRKKKALPTESNTSQE